MGYLIVGQRIDPDDWSTLDGKNQMPAANIVHNVLRQADKGNIILLHDGGGERAHTVAALAAIVIDASARPRLSIRVRRRLDRQNAR